MDKLSRKIAARKPNRRCHFLKCNLYRDVDLGAACFLRLIIIPQWLADEVLSLLGLFFSWR